MQNDTKPLFELVDAAAEVEPIAPEEKKEIEAVIAGTDSITIESSLTADKAVEQAPKQVEVMAEDDDIRIRLASMTVPQKIKVALFGNQTCRALLIRDPNRLISQFVLKNPRLQPMEVVEFARNPNLSEFILRGIAANQTWMKTYAVKLNLVMNPKTPGDISLKWLRFLNINDVRTISKSKNLPHIVVMAARKRAADEQQARG